NRLSEYLDSVRDVERRIQIATTANLDLPVVERPLGVPASFEEYGKLMFDLLALAYQSDLTRFATFMMACELSQRAYPEIGVPDAHHPLSHHGGNVESIRKLAILNTFHVSLLGHFVEKLRSIVDGNGSLLDSTVVLYGGGMSDSDKHAPGDVPTLLVGGQKL